MSGTKLCFWWPGIIEIQPIYSRDAGVENERPTVITHALYVLRSCLCDGNWSSLKLAKSNAEERISKKNDFKKDPCI